MPETVDLLEIRAAGTDFTNAYGTTPQCCPGRPRSSPGRTATTTACSTTPPTRNLDHSTTVQAYLRTRRLPHGHLFGKFLNNWDLNQNPPYFDDWSILTAGYCPFIVNEQGVRKTYPPPAPAMKPVDGDGKCEPADLGRRRRALLDRLRAGPGRGFLDHRESDEATDSKPWFLELTPTRSARAVYAGGRLRERCRSRHSRANPATFESDISDKTPWVGRRPEHPGRDLRRPRNADPRRRRLRSCSTLIRSTTWSDGARRAEGSGEQDTLVVFTATTASCGANTG